MGVTYLSWDGEEFSWAWYWVFRAAVADGVLSIGDVHDAHRSMALQAERVREFGLWTPSNPTGAAAPSPSAPHIRVGRQDHALDVDTSVVERFMAWLAKHGVRTHRPVLAVSGKEPWHVEALSEGELIAFARRCHDRLRPPRFSRLEQTLMRRKLTRRNRLALKTQARKVQLAARKPRRFGGGWDKHDRAKRFQALRKRALA